MRPVMLAALAGAAVLLPTVSAGASSSCGSINGGFENTIRTDNVGCTAARKLVHRWHDKAVDEAKGPFGARYVGNYACRAYETDPEHVKVYCADGTRKIRFFAGP